MILPIANVVSGFVLSAPKLKEWFAKKEVEGAEGALNKYRTPIGVIVLVLGIIGLLQRMTLAGFMYGWTWSYGSFPQSIIAIVMGLLLTANFFSKWPAFHAGILKMNHYAEWLGILGIIIGIGSLI
jgi:hypothetical protein